MVDYAIAYLLNNNPFDNIDDLIEKLEFITNTNNNININNTSNNINNNNNSSFSNNEHIKLN